MGSAGLDTATAAVARTHGAPPRRPALTVSAAAALREAGAIAEEVAIPWTRRLFEAGAESRCDGERQSLPRGFQSEFTI